METWLLDGSKLSAGVGAYIVKLLVISRWRVPTIGFVWLMPFLVLFVPDFRQKDRGQWLEIVYMAVVLALVAPVVFSPGGSLVAVCALFYLAHNRIDAANVPARWPAYLLWAVAAMMIAWSRMESLWIPWLLICPRFVAPRVLFTWSGMLILSGTISLLAMRTEWQLVVLAALLIHAYGLLRKKRPDQEPRPVALKKLEMSFLVLLLLAPFMLHGLIGISHEVEHPPGNHDPPAVFQQLQNQGCRSALRYRLILVRGFQ